jgi:hypothetical protein
MPDSKPQELKPSSALIAHGNKFVGVGLGRNSREKEGFFFSYGPLHIAHLEGRAVLGSRLTLVVHARRWKYPHAQAISGPRRCRRHGPGH